MYNVIIILLIAISGYIAYRGFRYGKPAAAAGGIILFLLTIVFFWFLGFWGELLWFNQLGYSERFWKIVWSKVLFAAVGAAVGWVVIYLYSLSLPRERKYSRLGSRLLGIFIGAVWGVSNWDVILRFWNRVSTGIADPILARDAGFYLFVLPMLNQIYTLVLLLSLVMVVFSFSMLFLRVNREQMKFEMPEGEASTLNRLYNSLYTGAGILALVLAFGKFLSRYHLLYSGWGVVTGPGWTDVRVRLPAYIVVIILTALIGIVLLVPSLRQRLENRFSRSGAAGRGSAVYALVSSGVAVILIWLICLSIIPGLIQWLRVEPNEITFEKEYIKNNIEFTRYGFNLENVEEREYPVSEEFSESTVEQNRAIFSNIRLWDWRALDAVYKQFQEIRLYYEFMDVDIDRYTFQDQYRQVMISAREMELANLPAQSQTFVNKRFKYTHGNGITLTPVNEFTAQGLPNLLVKDIPPVSKYPELEVKRPQIYYGELTRTHVIANTTEKEFDYPSGEKNIYIQYDGKGGVPISNIWRKFLFGWKFDGTRLFLSSYPTAESRIMFHREIAERVRTLAPFLHFDDDPYIVLADGKLYWIIDCYTTSSSYPYSERFDSTEKIEYKEGNRTQTLSTNVGYGLNGINYIRNSAKAVVDAYDGSVDFYIFDQDDPLIKVWDKIFPDLFQDRSEMPEKLLPHVRYPSDFLLVQGLVYAKYHMNDPAVFYNQEDLWIRATEKYHTAVQPVEPYYVMWELPDSDKPQFVLILPFTPKNRQVLIGWIAGMCDPGNYGRFLAYKFPKEKRVLGPQQVETKIDQDRYLSGQLTLWDQRGSKVIRGNVLAIPVCGTLLYVEPIYLQAETAAYPELRLVAVMHNDNLSYAESFDQALKGLFEKSARGLPAEEEMAPGVSVDQLIKDAGAAFDDYLRLQGERRFDEAAQALKRLEDILDRLSEDYGAGEE